MVVAIKYWENNSNFEVYVVNSETRSDSLVIGPQGRSNQEMWIPYTSSGHSLKISIGGASHNIQDRDWKIIDNGREIASIDRRGQVFYVYIDSNGMFSIRKES